MFAIFINEMIGTRKQSVFFGFFVLMDSFLISFSTHSLNSLNLA